MPENASWPRRFGALVLDWIASTLVTIGVIGSRAYQQDPSSGWVVLGVFALEVSVLTAFTGGSFGQLLTGIRVMTLQGRTLSLPVAVARTLLICVVVPPLVFKPGSGRGLHDIWTDSAAYRRP
ncbi:RDD family protein [Nocardioides korecus]